MRRSRLRVRSGRCAAAGVLIFLLCGLIAGSSGAGFTVVTDGIEMAKFPAKGKSSASKEPVTVIRIDPAKYEFRLLSKAELGSRDGFNVKGWCERYGLVAAINAGMYREDYRTHVGYMKSGNHVGGPFVKTYLSAAAFNPIDSTLPAFRIFDLDVDSFKTVMGQYGSVIQNLRLIKRPAENRWPRQEKEWSEAALGEDSHGRMLLIFCREAFSMHDFNELILSLPIDVVCAQHLEGGPEAQLYLKAGSTVVDLVGSFESGFFPTDANHEAWPIPNVIGIAKKGSGR